MQVCVPLPKIPELCTVVPDAAQVKLLLDQLIHLLPVILAALSPAVVISDVLRHFKAVGRSGNHITLLSAGLFLVALVWAMTDYVADHDYHHPSFAYLGAAFFVEVTVRYLEDHKEQIQRFGGFVAFLSVAGAGVYLYKENALASVVTLFSGFLPDKYFTKFLAFPSLAMWAFEKDIGGSVVGGSPLVQLCESIMLLDVYRHSLTYVFDLIRFCAGAPLAGYATAAGSSPLSKIVNSWVQLAWMCYVLAFLPDTKGSDTFVHSVVVLHDLLVIVYALNKLAVAFGGGAGGDGSPIFSAFADAWNSLIAGFWRVEGAVVAQLVAAYGAIQNMTKGSPAQEDAAAAAAPGASSPK